MIIGFVGRAGSGKSTAGDYICKDYSFKPEAFAMGVKDTVSRIFNWDRQKLEGVTPTDRKWREEKSDYWSGCLGYDVTPRLMLQKIGHGVRNILGDKIWIMTVFDRIYASKSQDFIITDARYPNEIKAIREHGGFICRIVRGPEPDWRNYAVEAITKQRNGVGLKWDSLRDFNHEAPPIHITEWGSLLEEVDHTIVNDGSMLTLHDNLDIMLQHFEDLEYYR